MVDSKKILQQQKDVLSGECSALRDKFKNAEDALNIAQKVNRVQENELARMQTETIGNLKGEVDAGKEMLEFSRVQYEAKESEMQAALAQNAILQETIRELNDMVSDLRARHEQGESNSSSDRILAQRELQLEQDKSKILEEKLLFSESELKALKSKCDALQNRVLSLQEESAQVRRARIVAILDKSIRWIQLTNHLDGKM
jgi:glycerol-3-phosphate O-acyltransferase